MNAILVVDDEQHMRWILQQALTSEHYEVLTAESGEQALKLTEPYDLVILDLRLPGMNGLDVLTELKQRQKALPVIVITAHGSIDTAISAMKLGADDYITKPFEIDELLLAVKKSLEVRDLFQEVQYLRQRLQRQSGADTILGQSEQIEAVRQLVRQIADSGASVLVTGESGTGKEVVARAIHACSDRANGPFIAVNCGAIPESLLESELFGHEKGAFTGAVSRKQGRCELAHGGTLFLDEIGELPPAMQVKLLRFLQEHTFERVGGTQTVEVDVRIIAATNRNLKRSIAEGDFREDLYYRLNVLSMVLPPLRERVQDIPILAEHFLARYRGQKEIDGFAAGALTELSRYAWPGNVRELENAVQRAVILARGREIKAADLPPEVIRPQEARRETKFILPPHGIRLEEVEKDLLVQALDQTGGNQTKAAALLGITRSALIYRMQKHNIE
ncbi:MAG TPA: sigma-54 dependent transcriptional regulator [Desulfobacteria bacterium]|nr:sigma-54 dependent transcriptional regulator [Desulfobacteria bacterium]